MSPKRERVRGIRCDKCKKEVSHVIAEHLPQAEAMLVSQENWLAIEHRKECDGIVSSFIEEA